MSNKLNNHYLKLAFIYLRKGYYSQAQNFLQYLEKQQIEDLTNQIKNKDYHALTKSVLRGVNFQATNFKGETIIHSVCKNLEYADASSIIGTFGVVPMNLDNYGCTPLHYAAMNGKFRLIKDLLKFTDIDVNIYDSLGNTPLHYLSAIADSESINNFIYDYGAKPNCANLYNGELPIHIAANRGNLNVVKLLKYISPINAKDGNGHTPLHKAVLNDKPDIIKYLLIQPNIDATICDNWGKTAAYYAQIESDLFNFDNEAVQEPNIPVSILDAADNKNKNVLGENSDSDSDSSSSDLSE